VNYRFSRLVVTALLGGSFLGTPSHVLGQQLRLILEGPFVLCQKDKGHIEIRIPQVVSPNKPEHFTPGIKSYFTEKELESGHDYSLLPDPSTPRLITIGTLQGVDPWGQKQTVTVDHISGKCTPSSGAYYVKVTVPTPDLIRPLAPVIARVYPPNTPKPAKQPYGTSSELLYQSVDLSKLFLQDDSGTTAWPPQVDPESGFLTIYLRQMHPDTLGHQPALDAYVEMMRMVGVKRTFEDPEPFFLTAEMAAHDTKKNATKEGKKRSHRESDNRSRHNDCHAPQLLVCQNLNCQ
jgi:hypothetical protein